MSPVPPIPLLSADNLAALRDAVPSRAAAVAAELSWLDTLDVRRPPSGSPPPDALHVVAFNAERGSRFDGILALLTTHAALREADVLLLNEVDWGMARSGNRHVARDLADALGMGYAFGVEFLELTKGERHELEAPGENTWSLHGNAILSRHPLHNPRLVRLPRRCSWAEGSQLRIGGRMALLAEVLGHNAKVSLACVHLENRTNPEGRLVQMQAVLSALPTRGAAVIAGDLNTATFDPGRDEELFAFFDYPATDPQRFRRPQGYEPLFGAVRAAGFDVDTVNQPDVPTSVPLGIPDPTYWLKLDWIFTRDLGLETSRVSPQVVPACHAGERLSDHDFVVARVRV